MNYIQSLDYNEDMTAVKTLTLKLPRETVVTPEAAQTFLSSIASLPAASLWNKLVGRAKVPLSLELYSVGQQTFFAVTLDDKLIEFVKSQISASYPLAVITQLKKDPLEGVGLEVLRVSLRSGNYYSILTWDSFKDSDPLTSILSVMAQAKEGDISVFQITLAGVSSSWRSGAMRMIDRGVVNKEGVRSELPDKDLIKEKTATAAFNVSMRFASNSPQTLAALADTLGVFNKPGANSLVATKPGVLFKKAEKQDLLNRAVVGGQVLNIKELATIWHLPNEKVKTAGIAWSHSVLSEPPENLPTSLASEEDKQKINFFGKTTFKNQDVVFGIKERDRRRHIWCIGKSGTGKSTLIANMVIDDLKKGRGVGLIDPHGDTIDIVLDYIPKDRINDVIFFNPSDHDYPVVINPLEVTNQEEAELVVSGIISIMIKIFGHSWGPRLEYILRNTLLSLAEVGNATLTDVVTVLTNRDYRRKMVASLKDDVLRRFWTDEFERLTPDMQTEAISPILNKVGQFVTSPIIRRVIGSPKSTISIDKVMNEGKILLVNLSQGRLGEDNASLLGAMLITKFQLAAMHRVAIPESERQDFYLYVDEFQNFATTSFIKILSEARKYRLSLMLANQYTTQIPEDVQRAILGNAGTMIMFTAGAQDALTLKKEFGEVFSEIDLVNLARYQIATRLTIDDHITRPFLAYTLALPTSINQNRDKVIAVSRERWAKKFKEATEAPLK